MIAGGAVILGAALLVAEYYMQNGSLGGECKALVGDYSRLSTLFMASGVFALFATIDFRLEKLNSFMKLISLRTIGIYVMHMVIAYNVSAWILSRTSRTGIYMLILQSLFVMFCALVATEILSFIPGVRNVLGLNYYKARNQYWKQKIHIGHSEKREV